MIGSRALRVALIRGNQLRPWEAPNYVIDGVETTFFASTTNAASFPDLGPVTTLPCVADATWRLSPRLAGGIEWFGGSLQYLVGLERRLGGFDIAHSTELANPVSLQAVRARDAGRCGRVVITAMENILFNRPQNELVRRRVARVATGVDHAIAISELARGHLETAGVPGDRISVQPVGIDLSTFSPASGHRPEGGPLRVVSVSRLEPAKGVEDLVIAAGLARREGCEIEVTLVGSGPSEPRIRELAQQLDIADSVSIETTTWPAVAEVYRRHDVFVLASAPTSNWREQYGFAVVEAMASGLPVVAGDSGSLPEIVGRPESLVRPRDPIALSAHLQRLAADPDLRARQGDANRAHAIERYELDRVRSRLRDIYAQTQARPVAGP